MESKSGIVQLGTVTRLASWDYDGELLVIRFACCTGDEREQLDHLSRSTQPESLKWAGNEGIGRVIGFERQGDSITFHIAPEVTSRPRKGTRAASADK